MDRAIEKIETLSEFKREAKNFIRGVIKAKVFTPADSWSAPADATMKFFVEKCEEGKEKFITICVGNGFNYAEFAVEVSTRVFNKVEPGLFDKTIEQFNKLKGFNGMTVVFE
jgi:hypothetical protein